MFLRLWAAVMTLAVPELRLLLEFSGMTAQLPTKSLLWLRMRQAQGNSPGEDSPCCSPRTGPEYYSRVNNRAGNESSQSLKFHKHVQRRPY